MLGFGLQVGFETHLGQGVSIGLQAAGKLVVVEAHVPEGGDLG
jgi:hypothetical protein